MRSEVIVLDAHLIELTSPSALVHHQVEGAAAGNHLDRSAPSSSAPKTRRTSRPLPIEIVDMILEHLRDDTEFQPAARSPSDLRGRRCGTKDLALCRLASRSMKILSDPIFWRRVEIRERGDFSTLLDPTEGFLLAYAPFVRRLVLVCSPAAYLPVKTGSHLQLEHKSDLPGSWLDVDIFDVASNLDFANLVRVDLVSDPDETRSKDATLCGRVNRKYFRALQEARRLFEPLPPAYRQNVISSFTEAQDARIANLIFGAPKLQIITASAKGCGDGLLPRILDRVSTGDPIDIVVDVNPAVGPDVDIVALASPLDLVQQMSSTLPIKLAHVPIGMRKALWFESLKTGFDEHLMRVRNWRWWWGRGKGEGRLTIRGR